MPTPFAPESVLNESSSRPKFPRDEVGFHTQLKHRVSAYFDATGTSDRDNWQMYAKTAFILLMYFSAYSALVFAPLTWWEAIPVTLLFAFTITAIGFSVQHDGGHGAYSNRPWINRLAAMGMDMIGASSYLWRWKHGVLHHTYPNVPGQDTDLDSGGVARLSPHQPRYWFHRYQHIYLWPLYSLTAPRWHLWGDFVDVVKGRIGTHKIPRPRGWDLFMFLGGKFATICMLFVIPIYYGHPWWLVLGMYAVVTGIVGVVLTVVFQLAHCVEEAEFPAPSPDTHRMEASWAVHQVETTVDFARTSRFLTWYLGGLNFQIVHHLFPRICHVHYPALSKIVEATCLEYGIRYSVHPTFLDGIISHYRWLKRLGRGEETPIPVTIPSQKAAIDLDSIRIPDGATAANAG